jgi:hypothetical protein
MKKLISTERIRCNQCLQLMNAFLSVFGFCDLFLFECQALVDKCVHSGKINLLVTEIKPNVVDHWQGVKYGFCKA